MCPCDHGQGSQVPRKHPRELPATPREHAHSQGLLQAGPTFSVMSLSQESMLSRNRSSVLPLLLLKLLLCMSCLQGGGRHISGRGPVETGVQT